MDKPIIVFDEEHVPFRIFPLHRDEVAEDVGPVVGVDVVGGVVCTGFDTVCICVSCVGDGFDGLRRNFLDSQI